jgi:hypothetical protein
VNLRGEGDDGEVREAVSGAKGYSAEFVRSTEWSTPISETATIKNLPTAFRTMKAVQADGVEHYRQGARQALAELLRGGMDQLIDQHLERLAELGRADRCSGCHWRAADRARCRRGGRAAYPHP